MGRKALLALVASLMTASAFGGTIAIMDVQTQGVAYVA